LGIFSQTVDFYRKLSKITPEIIVINKNICYRTINTNLEHLHLGWVHLHHKSWSIGTNPTWSRHWVQHNPCWKCMIHPLVIQGLSPDPKSIAMLQYTLASLQAAFKNT
jgi:hypothetical protein